MDQDLNERRWTVGNLARATGLTVRALHHFDEIGLLRPSERSPAGHRRYTADDVRRLYRILALRQLGMPLGAIASSLDGAPDGLEVAVRQQLEQVERHLQVQRQLHRRLAAMLRAVQETPEPSIDQLIQTMEAMMETPYFTAGQLARMAGRHREVGFEQTMAGWHARGAELVDALSAHLERGTDPADAGVQGLARRWNDLLLEMTGGDRALLSSLYAKLDGQGPEPVTRGLLRAEVWDYLKRAFAVGFGARA